MLGILVHGDNHFIVRGPSPDDATVLALVRQWTLIRIGSGADASLSPWRISTKEFREDLEWAVVVAGERPMQVAVAELLQELHARGVAIRQVE